MHNEQNFGWMKPSSACPIFSYTLLMGLIFLFLFYERLSALLSAKDVNEHEGGTTQVLLKAEIKHPLLDLCTKGKSPCKVFCFLMLNFIN